MDNHENEDRSGAYVVPTYWGNEQTTWYHFLHGNVPGHQIDFMYRPEVPQGALMRQHFSHLSRLMKYIEPQTNSEYAFAIGNLSRDDTHHEPGRGGIGMIFGFRIRGVTDHAGRRDPPFAHGIAAVGRTMDSSTLLSSSLSFYQHLFGKGEYDNPASHLYREYVRHALERSPMLSHVLETYAARFQDLPQPDPSSLSLRWLTNEAPQPKHIVIVHPNSAQFGTVAECAAKIAAVLYQSDIRWTCVTTGRESDLPGGVTVRLVATRDAGTYSSGGPVMSIDDVPDDDAELAEKLFHARRVDLQEAKPVRSWREEYSSQPGPPSTPRAPASEPSSSPGDAVGSSDVGGGAEPPKSWSQSAQLSSEERRAAMGLPPGTTPPPAKREPAPAAGGTTASATRAEAAPIPATPTDNGSEAALHSRTTKPGAPDAGQMPPQRGTIPDNLDAEPLRPGRSKKPLWIGLLLTCAMVGGAALYFQILRGGGSADRGSSGAATAGGPDSTAPSEPLPSPNSTSAASLDTSATATSSGSAAPLGQSPGPRATLRPARKKPPSGRLIQDPEPGPTEPPKTTSNGTSKAGRASPPASAKPKPPSAFDPIRD